MWFVDAGLMPAVERRNGEALHRLVEDVIQGLANRLRGQLRSQKNFEDLYRTTFWLLAAKLLHDKGVEKFRKITLTDVDEVFMRVGRHYADVEGYPPGGRAWRPAIEDAAATIATHGHLGNVSTESLAYLYENALIDVKAKGKAAKAQQFDQNVRKKLGIHSTPSVLIDHMLSQLWPLVEEHEPQNRRVFEPACGHAGFLVAALRWLRDFSGMPEGEERHRYLRDHLYGVEIDPFARELGKLSLTLADVPYGNHWRIEQQDMFDPGVLAKAASACTLLLANPPYEPFSSESRRDYERRGERVTAITKVVEMLKRSLFKLPPGGVFGVVVPQGVLYDRESEPVREFLLRECELTEIDVFADNLFEQADHEVAVLMGRRRGGGAGPGTMAYRRVRERGMSAFKDRLEFSSERTIRQSAFIERAGAKLLLPDLPEVWEYMGAQPLLKDQVHVQQGRQYWNEERLNDLGLLSKRKKEGWIPTILRADDHYSIWSLPTRVWLDPSLRTYRARGGGAKPGTPQVLVNYAPVAREPWRLKAVEDVAGLAISSNFVVVRPTTSALRIRVLWAVLNSPVANAFAFCWSSKRHTLVKDWRAFPLPTITPERSCAIEGAATAYLQAVQASESAFMQPDQADSVRRALLAMDAEVLRLYDLPPRLERQLLDLFAGVERKGVGCEFRGYYPPDLDAYVPLHELISDDYARSTLGRFREQHRPAESPEILAALRNAAEAFSEG
ncbi:MAG: N-6 DNA methylase [Planctomycetota bacterium]|nr:N-6 DNA methylase [Planctomycetota bacterium]